MKSPHLLALYHMSNKWGAVQSDSRYFDNISDNCFRFLPFLIDEQQLNSIHGVNENVDLSTLVPAVHYYRILMQEVSS